MNVHPEASTPAHAVPGIAACVINYNGERYLRQCLASIRVNRSCFDELLVVDNASTDASTAIVRDEFPEFELLPMPLNGGPGAARNAGFLALATADLILFVDNDVTLGPEVPGELVHALEASPDAALAMPRVLDDTPPHALQYDGAHGHFLGFMALERSATGVSDSAYVPTDYPGRARTIGSIVTACFLLHRVRWGSDPPFDEALFSQYEDHDLGLRCRLRGRTILSVPTASCRHGQGTPALSVRGDQASSPLRIHLLIRNRWRILLKLYRLRSLIILAPMLLITEVIQFAWVARRRHTRQWFSAAHWMLRNLPDTLKARRIVQRTRRVRDADYLSGGPLPLRPGSAATASENAAMRWFTVIADGYWRTVRRLL